MQRRVLRFDVPVDDRSHPIPHGVVLMVHQTRDARPAVPDLRRVDTAVGRVEVWVDCFLPDEWTSGSQPPTTQRHVEVFGTGQEIPADAIWLGSCLDGPLVWHLYEVGPA